MNAAPRLAFVVARAANGVIGRAGALPWRISSDLKQFRAVTMGKPVVMGRKTWESIGAKPLPGRANLVISRDAQFRAKHASAYANIAAGLAAARSCAVAGGRDEVCVIGGATLYEALMGEVDRLYLTEVDATPDGDAFFPQFDFNAFTETERRVSPAGPKDDYACVFLTLDRKPMPDR